jgi:hypothetical protein
MRKATNSTFAGKLETMRRIYAIFFTISLTLAGLFSSGASLAADDFFAEAVAVENRSAGELKRAAGDALTRVLVRVSGNEQILEEEAFAAAVKDAQSHVLLYSYQDDMDVGTRIFFEFDDAFVRGLFRDHSVLYWEQRRPPVVIWLALDEPFSRRFAARSDDVELLSPSLERFEARGVEVRFPLLDLADSAALPVNAIWERDFEQVRRASGRYGTEYALVGRWIDLSDGSKLVDWYYVGPEQTENIQFRASDLSDIWERGVDLAVDTMRDSLAVTLQQFEVSNAIAVSVRGVHSYADYRAVSSVFDELGRLVDLRIDSLNGDRVTYRVVGVSSAEQVARLIPSRSGLLAQSVTRQDELELIWESL